MNEKILIIVLLAIIATPPLNASEIPDVACPYEYDFSNAESGNGGQDYITDLPIVVENNPIVSEVINIDLYDWFGQYIESVEYDTTPRVMADGIGYEYFFTGLVDGTYTFVINDTYKGTFNVNHELASAINIDMGMYMQCYHDAYGNYIDPNIPIDGFYDYPQDNHDDDNYYGYNYNNDNDSYISMIDIEPTTKNETNSYTDITESSEETTSELTTYDKEQNSIFRIVILIGIVLAILLSVIFGLIIVIYKLIKSRK